MNESFEANEEQISNGSCVKRQEDNEVNCSSDLSNASTAASSSSAPHSPASSTSSTTTTTTTSAASLLYLNNNIRAKNEDQAASSNQPNEGSGDDEEEDELVNQEDDDLYRFDNKRIEENVEIKQQRAGDQHYIRESQSSNQQQQRQLQLQQREFDEVKQVELFGVNIVALTINGKDRLCLAQISNTLLRDFSYNEIHNRRVALGITCIQCTPIQLEMLRRAGAMPSSSRRCGMITIREAERLCRSFLVEEQPPELPENFYFTVAHRVNYSCKGRFVPARYISSRAKCIECFYCGEYYSPNKFIFHSHRQPNVTDCNPPDSPNINSWRKHIDLDWTQDQSQEIRYAWEDVKSLFNGGTRRRAQPNTSGSGGGGGCIRNSSHTMTSLQAITSGNKCTKTSIIQRARSSSKQCNDDDQHIDVECDEGRGSIEIPVGTKSNPEDVRSITGSSTSSSSINHGLKRSSMASQSMDLASGPSSFKKINLNMKEFNKHQSSTNSHRRSFIQTNQQHSIIEPITNTNILPINEPNQQRGLNNTTKMILDEHHNNLNTSSVSAMNFYLTPHTNPSSQSTIDSNSNKRQPINHSSFINGLDFSSTTSSSSRGQNNASQNTSSTRARHKQTDVAYNPSVQQTDTSNFLQTNQLYNQLMQPQLTHTQQLQSLPGAIDAQAALRHHLWTSLLANLHCNINANQQYANGPQPQPQPQQHHHHQHQQQQQVNNTQLLNPVPELNNCVNSANLNHILASYPQVGPTKISSNQSELNFAVTQGSPF